MFIPVYWYLKKDGNNNYTYIFYIYIFIPVWISKELSDKIIKPPTAYNNNLAPAEKFIGTNKIRVKFDGSCLEQYMSHI